MTSDLDILIFFPFSPNASINNCIATLLEVSFLTFFSKRIVSTITDPFFIATILSLFTGTFIICANDFKYLVGLNFLIVPAILITIFAVFLVIGVVIIASVIIGFFL